MPHGDAPAVCQQVAAKSSKGAALRYSREIPMLVVQRKTDWFALQEQQSCQSPVVVERRTER
eukprot:2266519-Lingulodinium_polyedra.AAC.1